MGETPSRGLRGGRHPSRRSGRACAGSAASSPTRTGATSTSAHEFPWEFYEAMAEGGWIGIAMPEAYGGGGQGITEASIVLEEVAASGRRDERLQRPPHVDLRDEPGGEARQRRAARAVPARTWWPGGCTSPSASPSPTPAPTPPASRTRATRDGDRYVVRGPQGLDDQGALLREDAAARAHHADRGGRAQDRRPDAAARRPPGARRSRSPRSRKPAATRWCPARSCSTTSRCRSTTGWGRRAAASPTCSTASTPSASSSPPRRSASAGWPSSGPWPTPTSGSSTADPIGKNQGIAFPLAEAYARLHAASLVVREAGWRYDRGLPCGEQANLGQVPGRRRRVHRRRPGHADPRRLRLRHRVRHRALLEGGPPDAAGAGPPGDGPQLRRRARARPAPLVRVGSTRQARHEDHRRRAARPATSRTRSRRSSWATRGPTRSSCASSAPACATPTCSRGPSSHDLAPADHLRARGRRGGRGRRRRRHRRRGRRPRGAVVRVVRARARPAWRGAPTPASSSGSATCSAAGPTSPPAVTDAAGARDPVALVRPVVLRHPLRWPPPATSVVVDPALPLEKLGPLGCGIQTGAGSVRQRRSRCEAGRSIVVFGAGRGRPGRADGRAW